MAVGQISSGSSAGAAAGLATGGGPAITSARASADPRPKAAGVTVTLSPEARQHLTRLEAFTATIGTAKQPKQMAKPGIAFDVSA